MKTAGIIAEYNPFHNGHLYHIEETRRRTGADYITVVMSGDFVQRGEPAIADKYIRTQMALAGGADLVFELPLCCSCASAEYFARGGIALLDRLGCIDYVSFGAEDTDLTPYKKAASLLAEEPQEYRQALFRGLKKGLSYPAARADALSFCLHEDLSFLSGPNNILMLEYLKALTSFSSSITPFPIKRQGAGYHDLSLSEAYPSASGIRRIFKEDPQNVPSRLKDVIPPASLSCLKDKIGQRLPVNASDFSSQLQYALHFLKSPEDISGYFDIDRDLANRIFRLRYEMQDFDSFCELCKTKNQTHLHIRRGLLHILLGMKDSDRACGSLPFYARLLGMKKGAAPLLHEISTAAKIPLIAKPSKAEELISSFEAPFYEQETALSQWQQNLSASVLYESVSSTLYHQPFRHENTRSPIII